jgi:ABC-type Zn uptake system ZnuABC Zn-binding protein ZnuA
MVVSLTRLTVLALTIVATAGTGGCDPSSDNHATAAAAAGGSEKPDQLHVVATVFALSDVARQVGGKYVQVEWVLESGQLLERFQPDAKVRQRLNGADLILAGSGAAESWAIGDSTNPYVAQRVVRLDRFVDAAGAADSGLPWLDPLIVQRAGDELALRFAARRAVNAEYFRYTAEAFRDSLQTIHDDYARRFAELRRRRVLALSGEFDPLLARYGVDVTRVAGSSGANLTPAQVERVRQAAVNEHVTILIARADAPPALLRDLSERTGLTVVALDPYGSSSTSTGRATYQDLIKYNLDNLLHALKPRQ